MINRKIILYLDIEGGFGGSSKSLYQLISSINKNKFKPIVYCKKNGPIVKKYNEDKIACFVEPQIASFIPLKKIISLVVKLQPSKLATRVRFPSPAPKLYRSVAQLVEHRSPKPGAGGSSPSTPAMIDYFFFLEYVEELMKILNIINFVKEVKQEGKKIVWPTRKETLITTAMVLLMVVVFSIFFLLVDNIIAWFIKTLMGL